jgi:DNA-directed RNA polymerase beta' subunit
VNGLTDEEIRQLARGDSGEVIVGKGYDGDKAINKRRWSIPGGLYDGRIFGVVGNCSCETMKSYGRCPTCEEIRVRAGDQMDYVGFINLIVPYVSKIKYKAFKSFINRVLPGIDAFLKNDIKLSKNAGSESYRYITKLWNTEFQLITPLNENRWVISVEGKPYDVVYKVADENSDINNCGLNFLYKIGDEYTSLKADSSKLSTYMNKLVLVAPIPMRSASWGYDGRPNYPEMTKNYAYLIKLNNLAKEMVFGQLPIGETRSLIPGRTITTMDKLAVFATINYAVNTLLNKYPILATSKQSLVRYANTMRVPQSGRANIISADVEMDKVLLPRSLAYTSAKSSIIKRLKDIHEGDGIDVKELYENPTPEVMQIFEDLINNATVVINRQPTLHKYGMLAFRAGLWSKDDFNSQEDADKIACIGMNVMVVTPFNADFDGDQMAYYLFLESPDKENVLDKMGIKNNWFYEKNGEPIFVPENSILCGLNVGSKLVLPSDLSTVPVYTSYEDLKFDFNNKVIEFDTPILYLGEYSTYGIETISNALGRPLKSILGVKSNSDCRINSKMAAKISAYLGALPDRINIMNELYKIGSEFVTYNGNSIIKLDELYKMQPEMPEIEEILKSDRSEKEKIHLLQDKLGDIIKTNVKNLMPTLYEESKDFGGGGVKGKIASAIESFTPRITYNHIENKIEVADESLVTGLSEEQYISHSIATRGILNQKAKMVPMSGYMTRQLVDLERNYIVKMALTSTDIKGIEVDYVDAIGRNKLDGTLITESEVSANKGKKVRIKSSIYTDSNGPDKWYVKSDEFNKELYSNRDNNAIGASVSSGTTEEITQSALALKHGGTLLKPTSDCFVATEDLNIVELGEEYMILGNGVNRYWYPVPKMHIYTKEAIENKARDVYM